MKVCLVRVHWSDVRNTYVVPIAGIFDDNPVVYESVRFQRAGFHDPRHNVTTIYEGAPNGENEAAWNRLLAGE